MTVKQKSALHYFLEALCFMLLCNLVPFPIFMAIFIVWHINSSVTSSVLFKWFTINYLKTKTENGTTENAETGHASESTIEENHNDFSTEKNINKLLQKLWIYCLSPNINIANINHLKDKLIDSFEKDNSKFTSILKNIVIEESLLGVCPLKISRIETIAEKDSLSFKIKIEYPGDCQFAFKLKEVHGSAKNLGFSVVIHVTLGSMTRDFTVFRDLSISFVERPVLTIEGGGILYFPVEILLKAMEIIFYPIMDLFIVDPSCLRVRLPSTNYHYPVLSQVHGILEVEIVEGKDLIEADNLFYLARKSSDPYCVIRLGRKMVKTNRVHRTVNPKWNFVTEFPILADDLNQELIIEIWDENIVTANNAIGVTSIDLRDRFIDEETKTDSWLNIASVTSAGFIRVRTHFVPCGTEDISHLASKKVVLLLMIRTVVTNHNIEPVVAVQISGQKLYTTAKGNYGRHHEFLEQIALVVDNIDEDLFRICLYDAASDPRTFTKALKRGILQVHRNLNKEIVDHKEKQDLDFYMIGDSTCHCSEFRGETQKTFRFEPGYQVDATVEMDIKLASQSQ